MGSDQVQNLSRAMEHRTLKEFLLLNMGYTLYFCNPYTKPAMRRLLIILCTLGMCSFGAVCAEVLDQKPPTLSIWVDTMRLGERIKVSMSYTHPKDQEVLFPDSSYNFWPFELVSKEYFPTQSDSLASTDSVRYTFTTFELQPTVGISLPVLILDQGDTSYFYSNYAQVAIREVIHTGAPPDSLRMNLQYVSLEPKVNYPLATLTTLAIGILALVVFLFFRKSIYRVFLLYRMDNQYKKFILQYRLLTSKPLQSLTLAELEGILSLWKHYLQKLEKTPYTTLTTKEISKIMDYNQLTSSLQNFDRAIYGGMIPEDLSNSVHTLRDVATQRYLHRKKEIQHVGRNTK